MVSAPPMPQLGKNQFIKIIHDVIAKETVGIDFL
jgi:hypothetical protein